MEYARNVLGIIDAGHMEANPDASVHFINQLSCSLVGVAQTIFLTPDSFVQRLYGKEKAVERFNCNYGLNESYRDRLAKGILSISGLDEEKNVRVVEIASHRFFIATLYMPQLSSSMENPHPLIVSFLEAADAFRASKQQNAFLHSK